jgi:shikimate kinase
MDKVHTTKTPLPASAKNRRTVVLVGMMVAGKSAVGRRLAARLGLPFVDSDAEIEAASGMSINRFFETRGEDEFRKGERRVIARLLQGAPCVLSTGGGAFMDPETRALILENAISIWIKADIEILVKRAARKDDRPLLRGGDARQRLQTLLAAREPFYAEAVLTVESDDRPVDDMVERVLNALENYQQEGANP